MKEENNGMRLFTSLMIVFLIGFSEPRFAQAEQANSCKHNVATNGTLAREAILQKPARSSMSGA